MRDDARANNGDEMTIAQAASEANARCGGGFTVRTLWRHIEKGALPIVRRGPFRRPRIRRSDFERYLVSN